MNWQIKKGGGSTNRVPMFKCTHFWITGDEIGVPVYTKTMQSCSSTCDTSLQSFQRQDDQEVHAISCFLSEADEMHYIGTPHVFPQRSSGWCVLYTRKWRHPCTLILILVSIARCELNSNMCVRRWINIYGQYQPEVDSKFQHRMNNRSESPEIAY
jgi:hypothetical protein